MLCNKKIFHDFYYGGDGSGCNSRTHFIRNHFFSYSTEIGCMINITEPVTLVADFGFSNTTRAHLGYLKSASPDPIIYVDFHYQDDFTGKTDLQVVKEMRKRGLSGLRDRVKAEHRKLEERRETEHLLDNFTALLDAAGITPNAVEQTLIDKLRGLIEETPENLEKWKAERAKIAKATRTREVREKKAKERKERKANKTRLLVREWFERFHPNFDELLEARYKHQFHGDSQFFDFFVKLTSADKSVCDVEINKELIKSTGVDHPSYVWLDDRKPGWVVTSQDIHMEVDTVKTTYKAWKRGKIKVGMHIGPYYIRELNDQYVQIGCHRIPMQNIDYLAKQLQLEA